MIRSMFSAVTGLRSHQTMMDVIGNNIANVNTAGFKSSRVLFKDLFYQTTSTASASTATKGGTSPQQIGYGATVASIDVLNTPSGFQSTGNTRDMYISGDGYFIVETGTGGSANRYFTRVGSLRIDSAGNLIDANGSFVMGKNRNNATALPTTPSATASLDRINILAGTTYTLSDYTSLSIGSDGTITGIRNGAIENLGQIALATFGNPDSLSQEGNTYFKQTVNSGNPGYVVAGYGGTGGLVSGGLEMSNVDLSKEFTDMILAQRGFQANSRVITTSDEILQELVNLKR